MSSLLHTKFKFSNGIVVKNRFVLAPMTNSQSLKNGKLGHHEFLWLKQFAQGGFGMIITCASHISKEGQGWANQLGIFDDDHIPSLKVLTGTLKSYGALAILQIYHGGIRSPKELLGHEPLNVNDLTLNKIVSVIKEYSDAAKRAEEAGFDGVEIHGANGYLITQFISTQTNNRTDEYGGVLQNRARFYLNVVKEIRKNVSDKFIVGTRLSPENFGFQSGLDLDENVQISQWLMKNGADYLHISTWDAMRFELIQKFRNALPTDYPVLIAGGLTSTQDCEKVIEAGASMVSLGKIAIGNPFFPQKSKNPSYCAQLPPFTKEYLTNCNVSEDFYKLLYKFPHFLDI